MTIHEHSQTCGGDGCECGCDQTFTCDGHRQTVAQCVQCGETVPTVYSENDGGPRCQRCEWSALAHGAAHGVADS